LLSGALACLAIGACGSAVEAGVNRWSSIGPEGNTVHKLAVSPVDQNLVYLSMGTDLYRSTDQGGHWIKTGQGVSGWVNSLVADRVNAETVYAATAFGVFKSSDRGATWFSIKQALPYNYVSIIVVDRANSLYLVNAPDANSPAQIYKSVNGGAKWEMVSDDPSPPESGGFEENLVTDPNNTAILYRSKNSGIYKTTDSGKTWARTATGATDEPSRILAVDPLSSSVLYGEGYGLFRSDDSGATWASIQGDVLNHYINALAIDPVATSTLYMGTDGHGLFRSTDTGKSWLPLRSSFAGQISVEALVISPSDPTTLFCAIRDLGFYSTRDRGANWSPRNLGLPSNRRVFALTGLSSGGFFAGTNYGPYQRDMDGSWLSFPSGLDCTEIYSCTDFHQIVVDPSNPQLVYAGTGAGVYKSVNGGHSWAKTGTLPNNVTALAIDPAYPQVLYAGTSHDSLFKSIDGAVTWEYCANGLSSYTAIESLLVDPVDTSVLYCGTSGAVYKSTNGGASWTMLFYEPYQSPDSSPQGISQMVFDPLDNRTIFAAGRDVWARGRVYRSTDAGATWKSVYANSFQDSPAMAIAIDPVSPATIYAAFLQAGVLKSDDRGQTWYPMNTGFPVSKGFDSLAVMSLLVDPNNHTVLYAGTDNRGVFEYRSDPAGPAELTLTSPNGGEYLSVGWPTTIKWTTAGSSPAISRVAIDYSPDNGTTFSEFVALAPNTGSYTLVLPALGDGVNQEARLRVRDLDGTSWDVSDRPFSLFGCTYRLSQGERSFGPAGGLGDFSVLSQSVCSWTQTGSSSWVQVLSAANGLGSGVVQYNVVPNTGGAARSTALTIAGRPYTITQAACDQTIALTSPPVPTAPLNAPYSWTLKAVCGTGPYSFALASGTPPPGLQLLPSGTIQGVPNVSGAFSFSVKATDSKGVSAIQAYTMRVSRAAPRVPRYRGAYR